MEPFISIKNLSKRYMEGKRQTFALTDINLEIRKGEFAILLGPSGCGKSTLLRIMTGLDNDYEGEVKFAPEIDQNAFSFVFQQFALLPWLTVYENVEMGLLSRDMPEAERAAKVRRELKRFGLEKFGKSMPKELSGGMKQRVGIARALVTDPKVIFMDEPFSELDSFTAEKLRQELLSVWSELKMTIVMVTHLIPEAIELADKIMVMTSRPGHIEAAVENELPRPRAMRSDESFKLEDRLRKLIVI
jgi:NitT/TauT family transport system ATP-binding protein